jgi:hypothetical protein
MAKSNKTRSSYSQSTRVTIVRTAWKRCFRKLPLQALFDKARDIENAYRLMKGKEFLENVVATLENIPRFVVRYARSLIAQGRGYVEVHHQKQRHYRHMPCAAH